MDINDRSLYLLFKSWVDKTKNARTTAVRNNVKNKEKELEMKMQSARTESEQIKNSEKCNEESESNNCSNRKLGKVKKAQRVLQKDDSCVQSLTKSTVQAYPDRKSPQIAVNKKKIPGNKINEKTEESGKKKANKMKEKTSQQNLLEEINNILNEELEYGPYGEAMKLHSLVCNRAATGYACDDSFGNWCPTVDGDGLYENFHLPYNRDLLCDKSRRIVIRQQPEVSALSYTQQYWWKILQDRDSNESTSKRSTKVKGSGKHKKKHNLYGKGNHQNITKDIGKYSDEVNGHKINGHEEDHHTEKRSEPHKKSDRTIGPQKNVEESHIASFQDHIEKENVLKEEKDHLCDSVEMPLKSSTTNGDPTLCFR